MSVSNLVENRGNSSWKLTRKTIYEQWHVMVKEYPFGTIAHLLTPFQANIVYSPAYSYWLGCLRIDSIFLFCGLISHWFFYHNICLISFRSWTYISHCNRCTFQFLTYRTYYFTTDLPTVALGANCWCVKSWKSVWFRAFNKLKLN